ncbi:MAG: hypothetical protein ACOC36_07530 [Fibrobacterota bacterium]
MSLQNQVSFTLEENERKEALAALATLENLLKGRLVLMDSDTRKQIPRMGDKSVGFVSKALEHAENNSELVPKYMDIGEMKTDFNAVSSLREIGTKLTELSSMVEDTMALSGSEAYCASLAFYHSVRGAAKALQPGAQVIYDDLRARFPRGSTKKVQATTEMETA